jgi:hypothetical protein
VSCEVIIHVSFHGIIVAMLAKRWPGFSEIYEQSWFVREYDRWPMADHQASTIFVGDFGFAEKNSRWSLFNDRPSERLVGRFDSQRKSLILDRRSLIDIRSTVHNYLLDIDDAYHI